MASSTSTSSSDKKLPPPTTQQQQEEEEHPPCVCIAEDWPWVWAIREPELLDWKRGLLETEIDTRMRSMQHLPVPILSDKSLYLGNALSVEKVERLQRLGITAVLNMAGPFAVSAQTIRRYKAVGIAYQQMEADDDTEYPLLQQHWVQAREFLDTWTTNKNKCVVNCMAGINRSGLIVSTYYMIQTQTPVVETVQQIRSQRGNICLHNEGFQEQLVAMARLHGLLGPTPGSPESVVSQRPPSIQNLDDWRVFEPNNGTQKPSKKDMILERLSNL